MDTIAGITVRAASTDDAETVWTLMGEIAAHQDQAELVTVTALAWRDLLARGDVTVLLAESGTAPVGYVSAIRRLHLWSGGDVLALDDLYVRPLHRDQGVGRLLMSELSRRAVGMTITWGVQPDNLKAIRFYERLGAAVRLKVICVWPAARQPA